MEDKEVIEAIKKIMLPICVCDNGVNGAYRPIKGTTKVECMNALGKIQELLREEYGNKWLYD